MPGDKPKLRWRVLRYDTSKTVMLGLRLTVQPINLFNALIAWRDGARDDLSELLGRIEGILRGSPAVGG